jgi:hypothetical protein
VSRGRGASRVPQHFLLPSTLAHTLGTHWAELCYCIPLAHESGSPEELPLPCGRRHADAMQPPLPACPNNTRTHTPHTHTHTHTTHTHTHTHTHTPHHTPHTHCCPPCHATSSTSKNIPEFPVEPEIALELLMAANFLGGCHSTRGHNGSACTRVRACDPHGHPHACMSSIMLQSACLGLHRSTTLTVCVQGL